ncbi:hypothetical protein LP420_40435 [Massilia sp. B-10]|nr:hypothetical protein LP420_40435 [Massilia sp. B-10]
MMLVAGVSTPDLQRQSAAALRRLLHPVGPDRDAEPGGAFHALSRLPGAAPRVRGRGSRDRRERDRGQGLSLAAYGVLSTIYRVLVTVAIALFIVLPVLLCRGGARGLGGRHDGLAAGLQEHQAHPDQPPAAAPAAACWA